MVPPAGKSGGPRQVSEQPYVTGQGAGAGVGGALAPAERQVGAKGGFSAPTNGYSLPAIGCHHMRL